MGAPLAVLREGIEDRLVNHGGGAAVGGPGRARGRRSRRLRLVIHDAHINQRSNWANSVIGVVKSYIFCALVSNVLLRMSDVKRNLDGLVVCGACLVRSVVCTRLLVGSSLGRG